MKPKYNAVWALERSRHLENTEYECLDNQVSWYHNIPYDVGSIPKHSPQNADEKSIDSQVIETALL